MKEAFKSIGWFFKLHYLKYSVCLIFLLIVSFLPVLPAKILGIVIDEISSSGLTIDKLIYYVIILITLATIIYIINIFYHYFMNQLGHTLSYDLRENYINHLFELDMSAYEVFTKGDLIARATNDLQTLTSLATNFLQEVIYYFTSIVSSLFMMIFISPLLTLASCIFMPIAIIYLNKKRLKKREYYQKHQTIYSTMTENVLESIEGVKTVRAYGQEENDYIKTKKAIDDDVSSWKIILNFEAFYQPLFELIYAIAYAIAIILGSHLVIENNISPGDLVTFLLYVGMLYSPLVGLSNILNSTNSIGIAYKRVSEILNIKPKIFDKDNALNIKDFKTIEFKNVCYKYSNSNNNILNNVSFTINKGETIGIVGPTGSGKTTLLKLLLRETFVTSGNILVDGHDISDYRIDDIRFLIGYVPQNHILFRRTITENILIGNNNATNEEINQAIKLADFEKDVETFVLEQDTMVSELGSSLSGGQKQRLSIARALVRNPKLLILDDSLSAVDAVTEDNIIKNLKTLTNDKTIIMISHRFASITQADKIIVIEDGSITDIGTHNELMQYDNWYHTQYLKQIKGDHNA